MPLSFSEIDNIASTGRIANVDGGRVTTLLADNYETARNIRVIDGPDFGNLTVNPDNSLALVLSGSDNTGPISFTVEIVDSAGRTSRETIDLRVNSPTQEAGWGTSEHHYMLETDARGDLITETGENHRDVYVSASREALSIADIAARENISRSSIDGEWLVNNPEYGDNPNMALAADAGSMLWAALHRDDGANSHWLHLERGYTYDNIDPRMITPRGIEGESELHPVVITAYGSGSQPVIADRQDLNASEYFSNIVIHDLEFTQPLNIYSNDGVSGNIILDSLTATESGRVISQGANGITVNDVTFHDIHQETPANGSSWQQGPDRISSLYVTGAEGVLIENSVFTETGWEDGYNPNGGSARDPQAPSMFSHNVYVNSTTNDMTFRDNISAQASSYGGQLRAGGFIEDNLFLDNNAGFTTRGGDYYGYGPIGNFTLMSGNVVTSGAHKQVDGWPGALTRGIENAGQDTVLLNNVVAHLTDPDRPWELQEKYWGNQPVINEVEAYYDNTVIYRWDAGFQVEYNRVGEYDANLEGLNLSRLDETTAVNLGRQVMNNPNATLNQFVDWLHNNSDQFMADQLLNYFRVAFGTAPDSRGSASNVTFIPSELTDGVRWDNRENWSTGDVAGTFSGDRVDLGGNWVVYGGTHTISSLDFGLGGSLTANSGRLNITGQTTAGADGATLSLGSAGQVWMNGGYIGSSQLDVVQDGGRFANTGVITGNVNLSIDDGQALLSAEGGDFVLGRGETLSVRGADASVGFDGAGNREGIIRFDSGSDVVLASDSSGMGSIGEFRSGAYREAPRVDSNIDLGGTSLTVDMSSARLANGTYVLMSADEITGSLGSFSIQNLGSRSATLTVNYTTDEVILDISSGSGVFTRTVGNEGDPPVVEAPPVVEEEEPATPPDSGSTGSTTPVDAGAYNVITPTGTEWRMSATGEADAFVYESGVDTGYDIISGFNVRQDVLAIEDGRGGYLDLDDMASVRESNGETRLKFEGDRTIVLEGVTETALRSNADNIFADIAEPTGGTTPVDAGAYNVITPTGTEWRMSATGEADAFVYESGVDTGYDIISGFNVRQDVLAIEDGRGGYLDLDDMASVRESNGETRLKFEGDRTIVLEGVTETALRSNADNIFADIAEPTGGTTPVDAGAYNVITPTGTEWRMSATGEADAFVYESGVDTGYDIISGFDLSEDLLILEDGRGGYMDTSDVQLAEHSGDAAIVLGGGRTVVLDGIRANDVYNNPDLAFGDAMDLSFV